MRKVDLLSFTLWYSKVIFLLDNKIIESLLNVCCEWDSFNHESPRRGKLYFKEDNNSISKNSKRKTKNFIFRKFASKRDWGHAKEFVEAQWKILQQKKRSIL